MKHFIQYIADQIPLQKFPHEMKKKINNSFQFFNTNSKTIISHSK